MLSLILFEQEKVKSVFDNLIQLEHLNIVKFHKYWADINDINRARVSSDSSMREKQGKSSITWSDCYSQD